MRQPLRIYLDQLHLGADDDATRELLELVDAGRVRVPISLTHFLETQKDKPSRRDLVREQLATLSRDEVIAGEFTVLRLEAQAAREHLPHQWLRDKVISRNVWDWVVPPAAPFWLRAARRVFPVSPAVLFRFLGQMPDDRRVGVEAATALTRGAGEANALRDQVPGWTALRGMGLDDLLIGEDDLVLHSRFRAMSARQALQTEIFRARAAGLEPNDLMDVSFLSVALPYMDAVCVDRRMYARIEEARKKVRVPWARAFRKVDELLLWLHSEQVRS